MQSRSSTIMSQAVKQKVTRIVQGHLSTIRDSNKGQTRTSYLEDQSITKKEFGHTASKQNKGNANSWSNRQIDWYNSERRMIFAVDPLSPTFTHLNKEFFLSAKPDRKSVV